MSLHLFLMDLTAYSAQIAIVVAIGSVAPLLLRLRRPDALLAFRHLLLAACLLLPFLQPWRRFEVESPGDVSVSMVAIGQTRAPAHRSLPWESIAACLLCAGMLTRFGWLGIGLLRLRRYRLRAEPVGPLPIFDGLQQRVGAWPLICLSPDVSGAVTFGILEPAVLLPSEFLSLPSGAQEAIVCHELIHVRRRDWAAAMIEEIIRAVFWFHPAIWWLLGQIQLSREQAVDAQVLRIIESREQYVHALLAAAASHLQPDLAPAPLFLRKTQLTRRVALIMKEVPMSKKRLLSSLAATCGALVIAARFATLYFPISAPAQEVSRGDANLLHRAPIEYPPDAMEKGIQGTVIVSAILNERGVVTDAHVISGPDALRGAALKSVLDWHYTAQAESPVDVAIDFKLPAKPARRAVPTVNQSGTVKQILFTGLSPVVREAVQSKLPFHEGDYVEDMSAAALSSLRQSIHEIDEHLVLSVQGHRVPEGLPPGPHQGDRFEFTVNLYYRTPVAQAAEKPTAVQDVDGTVKRIRVGGNVQAANIIYKPQPVYPPDAKQQRIQGKVRLNAVIGKDGAVQSLQVAFGDPALAESALESVRQWKYKPTLLNGQPVEVVTAIDVNYTLSY